jgi:sarcosine oxidase gamma subunit
MVSRPAKFSGIEADGLSVAVASGLKIASLRYFDHAGGYAAAVSEAVGRALPEPLHALDVRRSADDGHFLLAWRSPTETLLVCDSGVACADLERRLAGRTDGCLVDQTGGVCVIRLRGARAGEFLARLGSQSAIPRLGGALSGRCAEVPVLTACIEEAEFLCLVERVYAIHLLEWIRVTAADF